MKEARFPDQKSFGLHGESFSVWMDFIQPSFLFGPGYVGGCGAPPTSSSSSSSSGAPPTGADNNSANDYSETNTQVAGVDEADFVKNDGANIYIVADNQFKIVDAWPPAGAALLSSTPIDGTPKKLFVYNNKALIYSSMGSTDANAYGYSRGECTYGYDCDFTGDGLMLKITVFDIADKSTPKLEREVLFGGSYLNSRRIDSPVYTTVIFPEVVIQGMVYWPWDVPRCPNYDAVDHRI